MTYSVNLSNNIQNILLNFKILRYCKRWMSFYSLNEISWANLIKYFNFCLIIPSNFLINYF